MKTEDLFKKYPYIVAWGQMLGSFKYYIEEQVHLAEKDNAPTDSIYKSEKWVQASDKIKKDLEPYINGTKGGILR